MIKVTVFHKPIHSIHSVSARIPVGFYRHLEGHSKSHMELRDTPNSLNKFENGRKTQGVSVRLSLSNTGLALTRQWVQTQYQTMKNRK